MHIFNKQIFGTDAEAFLALDVISKVNWIKKHTNQQNDDVIDNFLANLPNTANDYDCVDCGKIKQIIDGDNISKGNAIENADSEQQELAGQSGESDSPKRQRRNKKRKD